VPEVEENTQGRRVLTEGEDDGSGKEEEKE
jgi:hypothetical protein